MPDETLKGMLGPCENLDTKGITRNNLDSKNEGALFEWPTQYCQVCQLQRSLFRRDGRESKTEGVRGKAESSREKLADTEVG
jgi:hypothetical protein